MTLGLGLGLTSLPVVVSGGAAFTPSLNFSDARNSQYVAVIF